MSWRPDLSRTVGTAAGSALALALLVCGCVFAAVPIVSPSGVA